MLLVDDSKINLLKMTERLLEVTAFNRDNILADYKKLTTEIDSELYNMLTDKIRNTDYLDLSLEEQIPVLYEFDSDYESLNELQWAYRNTYGRYTEEPLELSDINTIFIDQIRNRISAIQGYLLNNKYLESNKAQLEKLSLELAALEKKRFDSKEKFASLESNLKNNFVNAEGRILDNNGHIEYTNFMNEFKNVGYDLRELLSNSELLDTEITAVNKLMFASEEKLTVAKICVDNVPTNENVSVYDSIFKEAIDNRYRLTLLQMANIIANNFHEYRAVKEKRTQLKALNDVRVNSLKKMGINFMIDPFDRLRVDEQLERINIYDGDEEEIAVIRRNIGNLNEVIENRLKGNDDFMTELNNNRYFLAGDSANFADVIPDAIATDDNILDDVVDDNQVINIYDVGDDFMLGRAHEKVNNVASRVNRLFNNDSELESFNAVDNDYENEEDSVVDNETHDLLEEFIPINEDNNQLSIQDDTPSDEGENDLFIQDDTPFDEDENDLFIQDDTPFDEDKNDLFIQDDTPFDEDKNDLFIQDDTPFDEDKNDLFIQDDTPFDEDITKQSESLSTAIPIEVVNEVGTLPVELPPTVITESVDDTVDEVAPLDLLEVGATAEEVNAEVNGVNEDTPKADDLFQEEELPFEKAKLFSDRLDEGDAHPSEQALPSRVVPVNTEQTTTSAMPEVNANTMPDVFWQTKSSSSTPVVDDDDDDEPELSFDEQVDKLLNGDVTNEDVKVNSLRRKL